MQGWSNTIITEITWNYDRCESWREECSRLDVAIALSGRTRVIQVAVS